MNCCSTLFSAAHVTLWIAITKTNLFGPYFFEDGETTVTVNTTRYVDMLKHHFLPDLRRKHYRFRDVYFQTKFASEKINSKPLWPPRSTDLTTPDFFLFGYLKSKEYCNNPQTLGELKNNIAHEMTLISPDVLGNVMASVVRRVKLYFKEAMFSTFFNESSWTFEVGRNIPGTRH